LGHAALCIPSANIAQSISFLSTNIGALLVRERRYGLREDHFWPEGDFGPFVSGPRNPVSPMQIDLRANGARGFRHGVVNLSRLSRSKAVYVRVTQADGN
jgi:hypothetical protein